MQSKRLLPVMATLMIGVMLGLMGLSPSSGAPLSTNAKMMQKLDELTKARQELAQYLEEIDELIEEGKQAEAEKRIAELKSSVLSEKLEKLNGEVEDLVMQQTNESSTLASVPQTCQDLDGDGVCDTPRTPVRNVVKGAANVVSNTVVGIGNLARGPIVAPYYPQETENYGSLGSSYSQQQNYGSLGSSYSQQQNYGSPFYSYSPSYGQQTTYGSGGSDYSQSQDRVMQGSGPVRGILQAVLRPFRRR